MLEVRCENCGSTLRIGTKGTAVDPTKLDGVAYAEVTKVRNENIIKDDKENKKLTKEEQRNEQLAKYGFDPALFTSATIGNKTFTLKKNSKGEYEECTDPIIQKIFDNGYHWSARDDGRYVFVDTMRLLTSKKGWTETVNGYSYMWQFDILCRSYNAYSAEHDKSYHKRYCELKKLAREEYRDHDYFVKRVRFFNKDVITDLLVDYRSKVSDYIEDLKKNNTHRCKGREYIHICARDVYITDLYEKILLPIENVIHIVHNGSYNYIYKAFNSLVCSQFFVYVQGEKVKSFVDAYKGLGAYYSLRNLIMTKNCTCETLNGLRLTRDESLEYVEKICDENYKSKYILQGLLKNTIKINNYNFEEDKLTW